MFTPNPGWPDDDDDDDVAQCERCGERKPIVDQAVGLCAGCDAYNTDRYVL